MSGPDQHSDEEFLSGLDGEVGEGYGAPPAELSDAARYATMAPRDILIDMSWRALRLPQNWRGSDAHAMIIQLPSEAWVHPVNDYLRDNHSRIVLVEGKTKTKDRSTSDAAIIAGLDRGMTIIGIAVDPATQLSPLLRGAADTVVTMPAPTPDLMRRAIRAYTGCRCPSIEALDIAGLDLPDLAAALRPNASPASCVRRLKRASAAKNTSIDDTTPLLADLAGYGEARQWALDVLSDIGALLQGKLSAGELESAVFHGPPGTGKTLLARSLAKSSRLPLFQTSVSEWFHHNTGHLGDVLEKIDDIFSRAKNSAPSIIFLDEIDAIPDRNNLDSRSRDWCNSVITSVLLQIDAARNTKRGVIILAATNHIEHLDVALLRPGRLDRQFRIDPPDTAGLAAIMRSHLGADCPDADLVGLARLMPGATGADVTGVIRTARRHARNDNRPPTAADLKAAILPANDRSPDDLHHVAIHEAGHAVVAVALGFHVTTVSIKGTGSAGGWTDMTISPVSTREAIERRVMVLLAGRAANAAFGSLPDTGALSDLTEATRLLGAARVAFGLGEALVVRARPDDVLGLVARDRALADAIEADLQRLMRRTEVMVSNNCEAIMRLADLLIERLVLDASEIPTLAASHSANRPNVRAPRLTSGPTLLSGIAICDLCKGGMQLRTGKSGTYRYLTCANKANKGELSCEGLSVRMDAVDEVVLSAMETEVLALPRLKSLMSQVIDASNAGLEALEKDIARLQASLNNDKAGLKRLYLAIEKGIVDMLDRDFAQQISDAKLRIAESEQRVRELKDRRVLQSTRISDERIAAFSQQIRERLRSADPAFRRAWLHLFADCVVIGPDEIRILGPKQALAEGLVQAHINSGTVVPRFDREWRAGQDETGHRYVVVGAL